MAIRTLFQRHNVIELCPVCLRYLRGMIRLLIGPEHGNNFNHFGHILAKVLCTFLALSQVLWAYSDYIACQLPLLSYNILLDEGCLTEMPAPFSCKKVKVAVWQYFKLRVYSHLLHLVWLNWAWVPSPLGADLFGGCEYSNHTQVRTRQPYEPNEWHVVLWTIFSSLAKKESMKVNCTTWKNQHCIWSGLKQMN